MNDTLIHADIFFFITTIAVVLLVIVLLIVFYYIAKTVRTISRIADRVEEESEKVASDISDIRERLREESAKVSGFGKWLASFFLSRALSKRPKSHRKAKVNQKEENQDSE